MKTQNACFNAFYCHSYNIFFISLAANSDYLTVSTTIVFPAGQTEVIVPVSTVQDTVVEPTENFTARLSNPQGASLGANNVSTVHISDDDGTKI